MKIFGFNIGKAPVEPGNPIGTKNQAFSTPFGIIGDGNLSLPHVDKYYTINGYVQFGNDNLYPQLLNQLTYTSAIHGAIIEFIGNAVIGGGYKWENDKPSVKEIIEVKAFEKFNKFSKLTKTLTRDYLIHRRVCVIITKKDGVITKLTRIDPSTIRNHVGLKTFMYSSDWSRGSFDTKEYQRYDPTMKNCESIYIYQENTPGQDIYPIPNYNSILNWAFLDGEIAYFQKSNIQNAVFPSAVIRRPKEFGSIEEVQLFKAEIASKTGASNGGKLVVLTGNGFDDVPEFQSVSSNNNDKLFETVSKDIKNNICLAHSINPSIMGVKTEGSLGNSQELEISYSIFEKNVIMPLRDTIEEILNDLIDIAKIQNTLVINDFQIIEKTIVETPTQTKPSI